MEVSNNLTGKAFDLYIQLWTRNKMRRDVVVRSNDLYEILVDLSEILTGFPYILWYLGVAYRLL